MSIDENGHGITRLDGDEADADIAAINERFPGWYAWRTRGTGGRPGELMATRRRDLTERELHAGLCRTLPMGYGTDLRRQLAEQVRLESVLGGPCRTRNEGEGQ